MEVSLLKDNSEKHNVEHYETLVQTLINAGLEPSTNWFDASTPNSLFLRHDIDFGIDYAHQLALVEQRLKVKSTFFFMLTSNTYNLLSGTNQKLVKNIASMGHKVSMHYDPNFCGTLNHFMQEKNIFENIIGKKIDIVSIHRPGPFLEGNNVPLYNIPHTYQDIYFKEMKYISDSGGSDIFPALSKYLQAPRQKGLHLLLHPIWWFGNGNNATETLNNWREQNINFITTEIRKNCRTYTG